MELSGVGLHTGKEVQMTIRPAEPDTGLDFVRIDLPESPRVPVSVYHVANQPRQTALSVDAVEVNTVEHLLAALSGLEIDNVRVEMNGPEVPGCDGSSKVFVDAILEAGLVEQKSPRRSFTLAESICLSDDNGGTLVAMPPSNGRSGLEIEYTLDYGSPLLPVQHHSFKPSTDSFIDEIAPARTFCLESESKAILKAGLGKGATYSNTLVVGEEGVIENELRFQNEFVRHKILDLIGDLYLLRVDLNARVVASRTGHRLNARLAKQIHKLMQEQENRGLIQRDTGLDIREIMRILPHRYPFLLIDRVIEIEGYRRAVGIKNVSINEPFFQGHWPDQPIMPGVLQIEAMAQLAGVLLLRKLENTGKLAVLLSIDRVKLRKAVVPGDQLRLEAEALKVKARAGKVKTKVIVNGDVVTEAIMKFMLADA